MAIITKPVTVSAGQDAKSADINNIADTIYNDYNGNITNANLSASAAIIGSKLDLSAPGNIGVTTPGTGNFINLTAKTTTANMISISCGAGTGNALTVANIGTNHGIAITQTGVLATTKAALLAYSDVAQVTSPLVWFNMAHVGSDKAVLKIGQSGNGESISIDSTSTSHGIVITQTGVLATNKAALLAYSDVAQVTSPLVWFNMGHVGSDKAVLKIGQSGTGVQILGEGNENLSNAGVWTDRSSTFSQKNIIGELDVTGFANKLKVMKMYTYTKKIEREKNLNSRVYKGYVLDEPTTPSELISIDNTTGELSGVSAADGVNFLLAVCKEMINRIEILEKK